VSRGITVPTHSNANKEHQHDYLYRKQL
jgi:hypothetical protein